MGTYLFRAGRGLLSVNTRNGVSISTKTLEHTIALMRPVGFGEALAAGTPINSLFRREARPLLYCHQVLDGRNFRNRARTEKRRSLLPSRRRGRQNSFTSPPANRRKRKKTAGASRGLIRQASIQGLFLMARSWRNREAGLIEYWSIGLLRFRQRVRMQYDRNF